MSFQRLITIIRKEFLHIKRDKTSLGIVVAMPLIFILVFGYAVNTDVDNIEIAVLNLDKTLESREYIDKFLASNYFKVKVYVDSINDIESLINKGKVKAAIIIPAGFERKLNRNESPQVQMIIDGSDPTIARTALQSGILISKVYSIKRQEKSLIN